MNNEEQRFSNADENCSGNSVDRSSSLEAGFAALVVSILQVHKECAAQAIRAVNVSLTLRNWLQPSTPQGEKVRTASAQSPSAHETSPDLLVNRLSYSHLEQLVELGDAQQRVFYETEALRGHWSVRELKRQIATQYYQRSGLSTDQPTLFRHTHAAAEQIEPQQVIRDPYVFEFLGLKSQEVMTEGQLEDALLDKLQAFLLELGHGFCFEARQKRLLIGGEHFFADLVFYHRVLKCHVLIELKNMLSAMSIWASSTVMSATTRSTR